MLIFVIFKQKTAYEMRMSDWSSDVCSSDLLRGTHHQVGLRRYAGHVVQAADRAVVTTTQADLVAPVEQPEYRLQLVVTIRPPTGDAQEPVQLGRRRPCRPFLRPGRRQRAAHEHARRVGKTVLTVTLARKGEGRIILVDHRKTVFCIERSEEHTSELQSLMRTS